MAAGAGGFLLAAPTGAAASKVASASAGPRMIRARRPPARARPGGGDGRRAEWTAKTLMKLATYKDGSRDGQLVLVSRDLTTAHYATGIASRLQQALDDWNFIAPQLQDLYEALNAGKARHPFPFDPAQCLAPLPRAYQRLEAGDWMDGPIPMLSSAASAPLLGARSPIPASITDSRAGLAVIIGDVPPGASPEQGQDAIRLMTLIHRLDIANDMQTSIGVSSTAALGPTAVTPDELGAAWRDARVHLNLSLTVNGQLTRSIKASDMRWSFGEFIAAATGEMLPLATGAIVGSGVIGKSDDLESDLEYVADSPRKDLPPDWLRTGDIVRLEMLGPDGQSLFGAIEQAVE